MLEVVGDAQIMARMRGYVARYGYGVQAVAPRADDVPDLSKLLCYTFGLTGGGLPELVVSGAGPGPGKVMLDAAVDVHLAKRLVPGQMVTLDCLAKPLRVIDAVSAPVTMAWRLYGRERVHALQLLWPDPDSTYPDETGWNHQFTQPVYGMGLDGLLCMICHEPRPEVYTSVTKRPTKHDLTIHVTYCNDRPECVAVATAEGPYPG